MSNDKFDRGGYPVLSSLREMLGLEGDAFVSAMKEAVWVPGGVDQLADIIIRSLSPDDQCRLTQELPDEPEVMALIGRLLMALNEHPKRKELGESVMKRAKKLGERAQQYLSPDNWYPPVEDIRTILVSPYRLHAASIMMRMQWGGEFDGIEAMWMIRFAAGDSGEVYFITEDIDKEPLNEMRWMEISMDQALSLIASVSMVQSAVQNHFPFDGMVGVGLYAVLLGGCEVNPWVDSAYLLEAQSLTPQEVALAELNALGSDDYLAAYDLLDASARPGDVLQYLHEQVNESKTQGDLWRLDASLVVEEENYAVVSVRAWYRTDEEIVDRAYQMTLAPDANRFWRIIKMELVAEAGLEDAQLGQYLANHPRYYTELTVADMEVLAETMSDPPQGQSLNAVHFSSGPEYDYRRPYDIGTSRDMHWTVILGEDITVLVWASNELSLRREIARLQDEGAVGEPLRSGVMDLLMLDVVQNAADEGPQQVELLLGAADAE